MKLEGISWIGMRDAEDVLVGQLGGFVPGATTARPPAHCHSPRAEELLRASNTVSEGYRILLRTIYDLVS